MLSKEIIEKIHILKTNPEMMIIVIDLSQLTIRDYLTLGLFGDEQYVRIYKSTKNDSFTGAHIFLKDSSWCKVEADLDAPLNEKQSEFLQSIIYAKRVFVRDIIDSLSEITEASFQNSHKTDTLFS